MRMMTAIMMTMMMMTFLLMAVDAFLSLYLSRWLLHSAIVNCNNDHYDDADDDNPPVFGIHFLSSTSTPSQSLFLPLWLTDAFHLSCLLKWNNDDYDDGNDDDDSLL